MWRNSTGTISLMTSTLFLTVSVATSSTVLTKDIFRYEDAAAYQSYISTRQNNSAFGEMNNTDSANAAVPEDLKKSLTKISLIASLQDNWNGNGALAYSAALIEKIKSVVLALVRQPEIFPTAANSIQLEYDGDENSYLEIEIFESGPAEVFRINRDGSEECFKVNDDGESLNGLVTLFYG